MSKIKIICIGDSVTLGAHAGNILQPYGDLLNQYHKVKSKWFGAPGAMAYSIDLPGWSPFMSKRIPKIMGSDAFTWFDTGVLSQLHKVRQAVLLFGINEVFSEIEPSQYRIHMENLIEKLFSNGIDKIYLMGVYKWIGITEGQKALLNDYRNVQLTMIDNMRDVCYGPDLRYDILENEHFSGGDWLHINQEGHHRVAEELNTCLMS